MYGGGNGGGETSAFLKPPLTTPFCFDIYQLIHFCSKLSALSWKPLRNYWVRGEISIHLCTCVFRTESSVTNNRQQF